MHKLYTFVDLKEISLCSQVTLVAIQKFTDEASILSPIKSVSTDHILNIINFQVWKNYIFKVCFEA